MARAFGWLIAGSASLMVLQRLTKLMDAKDANWPVVLMATAAIGVIIAIVVRFSKLRWQLGAAIHLIGLTLVLLRVTAPDTLTAGIIPGPGTFSAVKLELDYGMELLRFGASPVLAVAGLVAMLSMIFWVIGWAATSATMADRPELAGVIPLVFYLQLATIDRGESPAWSTLGFALLATASLLLAGPGRGQSAGRMRKGGDLTLPHYSKGLAIFALILTVTLGVGGSRAIAGSAPVTGALAWRAGNDASGLYGGGSANIFVNLQQSVLNLSDEPVFIAAVSQPSPPNEDLYWHLITLDVYDGQNWMPSESSYARAGIPRFENPEHLFQGPTQTVAARVRIAGLTGQILPVFYSPTRLDSSEDFIADSYGVRADGAVRVDVSLRPEWEYQILAALPLPNLGALMRRGDELSPLFDAAQAAGAFTAPPGRGISGTEPTDLRFFTELPASTDTRLAVQTRRLIGQAATDFERAILLESWFRDDNRFVYSTDVSTGGAYLNLMDWLFEPTSLNYRTGYCEQFATAMALMARSVGIPARVVLGYTPGEIQVQDNGTEVIVVRARNAHAWVQLWMDGQGWVRFDPTPRSDGANRGLVDTAIAFDPSLYLPPPDPGQLPDDRRPDIDGPVTPGPIPLDELEELRGPFNIVIPDWAIWVFGVIALWMLIPLARLAARRRRVSAAKHGNVVAAWNEILVRLGRLGESLPRHLTPLELAGATGPELEPLAVMYTAHISEGTPSGSVETAFYRADEVFPRRYETSERIRAWIGIGGLFSVSRGRRAVPRLRRPSTPGAGLENGSDQVRNG